MAGRKRLTKFYLLDSSNIQHLAQDEGDLPDLMIERIRERIKLGLRSTSEFQIRMTIQCLFDQRSIFAKIVQSFNNDGIDKDFIEKYQHPTLARMYTSCHLNNMLRHFQFGTDHLGNPGELNFPTTGLFIA